MLRSIGRNTHPTICLVAVAVEDVVLLLILALGAQLVVGSEDQLLCAFIPPEMPAVQPAYWLEAPEEKRQGDLWLHIRHGKPVTLLTWHGCGDFLAVVLAPAGHTQVLIH
ncbi:ribosome biogenesis protein BOP1-like [Leopardus geoffroyi]|uniref:ribosome biogenesis protein BOP1-like n=1 Tax=Leopardus geoffroyi TaxID=46844 RepID=UPI001E263B63|nr:ribosome biogenesis protein BOP1-like [Leopardus geoffroyi]